MKHTTFQIVLITIVVTLALAFGLPIGFSLANHRTAVHHQSIPVRLYDTSLDTKTLNPELFGSIVNIREMYSTNDMVRLFGLLFERRFQVLSVDNTDPEYPAYTVRVYTYFNIPIQTYSSGMHGEWQDVPLYEF